jgi:hypothetical protein
VSSQLLLEKMRMLNEARVGGLAQDFESILESQESLMWLLLRKVYESKGNDCGHQDEITDNQFSV